MFFECYFWLCNHAHYNELASRAKFLAGKNWNLYSCDGRDFTAGNPWPKSG